MSRYIYASISYDTMDEVEAAVTAIKKRLDNNPTDWCVVKPMINPRTIKISTGDVIGYDSGEPLTDTQINSLSSSENVYNVFAVYEGDNFTEVLESEVADKVKAMRKGYATWLNLTKYVDTQVEEGKDFILCDVTNEDMSGYV
tara:strand:- start:1 stop:429 length:429 start_codon:yes stop_codon:yes gene_type:complete